MNKSQYNGYTNGQRDRKTLLKIPVQTSINICELAQAYSSMKAIGKQPHSKSEILETAFNYYMQFEGFKGQRFDEADAVAFLSQENLGVKIDNKRHKRAVDMYTIDNPHKPLGIVYPDRFADRRDISTEEEILRQRVLAETSRCIELNRQICKADLNETVPPEKKRLVEQQNYDEYVKECEERGIKPMGIREYMS